MSRDLSQATVYKEKVRPASAVSRWSMDSADVSDGKILDSWGSNDGSLNGGVSTGVSGVGGSEASSFDGSDDYIVMGDKSELKPSVFTISQWVKYVPANDASGKSALLNCNDYQNGGYWAVTRKDNNETRFRVNDSSTNYDITVDYNEYDPRDMWSHFVFLFDGDKLRAFINGSEVDNSPINANLNYNSTEVWLGNAELFTDFNFSGKIDEVRVYSEALSQQQIWKLYNIGRNANWGFSRS